MIWDNIISLDMYNLLGKILLFLNKNAEAIFRQTLISLQAVLGTSTHPLSCLSGVNWYLTRPCCLLYPIKRRLSSQSLFLEDILTKSTSLN